MFKQIFLDVELLVSWMGHPAGTTHRLGERLAKMLIERGTAKVREDKNGKQETDEKEITATSPAGTEEEKEVGGDMEKEQKAEPKPEVKMETGKQDKMVRRSIRK